MFNLLPQQFNNKKEFLSRFIVASKYLDDPIQIYYDLQDEKLVIIQERATYVKYALFYYDDSALALPFFEKKEDFKDKKVVAGFVSLNGHHIKIYDLFGAIDMESIIAQISDAFDSEPRSFITKFPLDELNTSLYTHYITYNGENNPSFKDILQELKENTVITVRHNLKGTFYALVLENDEVMSIPLILINKKVVALLGFAGKMEDFMLGNFEKGIPKESIVEFKKALEEFSKKIAINILAIELVSNIVKYVDDSVTDVNYMIRKLKDDEIEFTSISGLFSYSIDSELKEDEFEEIKNRLNRHEVVLLFNKLTQNLQVFIKIGEVVYTTPILPLVRDAEGNIIDLHAVFSNALSIRIALNGEFVNLVKFKNAFEEEVAKLPEDFDKIDYSSIDLSEFARLEDASYYGVYGLVNDQDIAKVLSEQQVLLEVITTDPTQLIYLLKDDKVLEIPAVVSKEGEIFAIQRKGELMKVGDTSGGLNLELIKSLDMDTELKS